MIRAIVTYNSRICVASASHRVYAGGITSWAEAAKHGRQQSLNVVIGACRTIKYFKHTVETTISEEKLSENAEELMQAPTWSLAALDGDSSVLFK